MKIFKITNPDRRWYQIIIWWEIRRILYNFIMYWIGIGSFYICFVTIPLVYLVIALLLNIIYTLGWLIELLIIKRLNTNVRLKYPTYAYLGYLAFSATLVIGFALYLLLR